MVAAWLLCLHSVRSCKKAAERGGCKRHCISLSLFDFLFRFSKERFRKLIRKMFPVLNWLFSYQFREWILRDLHAGLNIGIFQIPQGRQREKKHFCFLSYVSLFIIYRLYVNSVLPDVIGLCGNFNLQVP